MIQINIHLNCPCITYPGPKVFRCCTENKYENFYIITFDYAVNFIDNLNLRELNMTNNTSIFHSTASLISAFIMGAVVTFSTISAAQADALPANVQAKVDSYKKKLTEWAADPVLVAAVKAANAKGPLAGMGNAKWTDLEDKDPLVLSFQTNEPGKVISTLDKDAGISKLYLRDENANLIASSNKPLLYNNATKPWISNPLKEGKPWAASEIKPDPATQVKGVHLGVPVLSGGKAIGVLHTSVVAE